MQEDFPILKSCKPMKSEFENVREIQITSKDFTIGRGLHNTVVIPFLGISRNHCKLTKRDSNWILEDCSSYGININGVILGRGKAKKLVNGDVIKLEPSHEFVYIFESKDNNYSQCSKRIKLDPDANSDIINNMKMKFEASQSYEMQHIEDKIQNAKDIQTTNILLKEQLQSDMKRKISQLESDFALQIENLKGEKYEVEKQKLSLIQERDAQLADLKASMEVRISELMEQIGKHNEIESELIIENNQLKEKLLKEREEFLSEINRENSSKQDLLDKLEAKIREQEEVRLKEKQELEDLLRKETEQLKLVKEKELHELAEQKKKREQELMEELSNIRKNLEEQVERTEQQKCQAAQLLNEQIEEMKKINNEDKVKVEQLVHEREEILKRLNDAQENAQKSVEELQNRVTEREIELATLAAERIQKQAEQSSGVITSLQEQLEKVFNTLLKRQIIEKTVRSQLQSVEDEKKKLQTEVTIPSSAGEGSSKSNITTVEFGEMMESELQCSICAELFVSATTLNCSHTFCRYCITMWKKKKKDCPICRATITSECKSLVLDSFIEKALQNLSDEMKSKRQELLKSREELEAELVQQLSVGTSRRSGHHAASYEAPYGSDWEYSEEGEEEEYEDYYEYGDYYREPGFYDDFSYSGSDSFSDDSNSISGGPGTNNIGGGSRRGRVAGRGGAYYGGYGRCFKCGARGHWAPGCPF